MFYEEPIND